MYKYLIIIFTIGISLQSCNDIDLALISVGDTKQQVINVCGRPGDLICKGDQETFLYYDDCFQGCATTYAVIFVNGHVVAYGDIRAFDDTPRFRVDVNANVNGDIRVHHTY